jgi:hypothetical protein
LYGPFSIITRFESETTRSLKSHPHTHKAKVGDPHVALLISRPEITRVDWALLVEVKFDYQKEQINFHIQRTHPSTSIGIARRLQEETNWTEMEENKDTITLKVPLHKVLRNPEHLEIYREIVTRINRIVTASYLFARFIFLHAYEDDANFNVDMFVGKDFFTECLKSLQTRAQRAAKVQATIRNRALIDRYIGNFCQLYRYERMEIRGIQSNWELYIGAEMSNAYLNNAGLKTGQHFRTLLNHFFDVRETRAILRRDGTTAAEKRLARACLDDIFSFKDIISNVASFEETQTRMDEIESLGPEYVEAFYFFGPWLEQVGTVPPGGDHRLYQKGSLWYEITAAKSVHSLYHLAILNTRLPEATGRDATAKFQVFPIRHTFIPRYIVFDLRGVAAQILGKGKKEIDDYSKNHKAEFWEEHFRTDSKAFSRVFRPDAKGREFNGTFRTDGYGVSIIKQKSEAQTGAGRKRKPGEKRKDRDTRLFPPFSAVDRDEIRRYDNVVFADPNLRDMLYMMGQNSTRENPSILRHTSMTRRRYLCTKVNKSRAKRFVKHQPNADEIKEHQDNLSHTNAYSISSADFQTYCSVRGVAKNILGPLYEQPVWRKMRWRASIGNQRDFTHLGNQIRKKFGNNPLIVLGDRSVTRATQYHAPTQGVGLRYILHRLRFRVVLLDEHRTSATCPDCHSAIQTRCKRRQSPRPWRRKGPLVWVHGLLQCNSNGCMVACGGKPKMWNRDLLAVSNFRRIFNAYMNGDGRPDDLERRHRPPADGGGGGNNPVAI